MRVAKCFSVFLTAAAINSIDFSWPVPRMTTRSCLRSVESCKASACSGDLNFAFLPNSFSSSKKHSLLTLTSNGVLVIIPVSNLPLEDIFRETSMGWGWGIEFAMAKPSATDCEIPGSRAADILAAAVGEVNMLSQEAASISSLKLAGTFKCFQFAWLEAMVTEGRGREWVPG